MSDYLERFQGVSRVQASRQTGFIIQGHARYASVVELGINPNVEYIDDPDQLEQTVSEKLQENLENEHDNEVPKNPPDPEKCG